MHMDNTPYTRLTPLLPDKWWSASGDAAGKAFFQGSYGVELLKNGRWLASYNETTRLPDAQTDFATKEAAMQACVDERDFAISRAQYRIAQRATNRAQP